MLLGCTDIPELNPGVFKGGGWYLGVAESMGHAHKMLQFGNRT